MFSLRSTVVFAALLMCICTCNAQNRPFYAGSSGGGQYPGVLPQNMPSTTINPATDLDNRFGPGNTTPDPYKAYERDPVYNVEKDIVDRVKDLPREKQPYWYVNAAHLNQNRYTQQQLQAQIQELNERLQRLQEAERQQQQVTNATPSRPLRKTANRSQ